MTTTPAKRAEMIVHEQEPYNAEPPRAALAEHLITPVEVFYGRNHGTIPEIDPLAGPGGRHRFSPHGGTLFRRPTG